MTKSVSVTQREKAKARRPSSQGGESRHEVDETREERQGEERKVQGTSGCRWRLTWRPVAHTPGHMSPWRTSGGEEATEMGGH